VLATSGLITAIIGLALQSNLSNIVSVMFLTLERPFNSGDWISVDGEDVGQVKTISWRTTRLVSLENTEISIPNDKLAHSSVINMSSNDKNFSKGGYIIYDKISVHPRHEPKYIIELLKDGLAGSHPADGRIFFGYTNAWLGGSSENGLDFWIAYDCTNRWYQYSQRSVVMLAINHVFTKSGVTMTAGNLLQNMKPDANLKVIEDFSQNESNYRSLYTANNNIYLESQVVELWFKRVPLFEPLTERDFKALARSSIKRDFKSDEIIIEQGDDGQSMFVVMEGVVGVEVVIDKKKKTQVNTLSIGDVFGEMSLLTGAKRTASVRAIRPVVVYEITKSMFAKIFKTNKKAIDGLTKILVERQEELDKFTQETKDSDKKPKNTFSNLKQAIVNFFKL
jgi:branched-chain amino acid transport system substrate-binding protein